MLHQKGGRGGIKIGQGGQLALRDQRRYGEADAEPDQYAGGLATADDERQPLQLPGIIEHVELVQHVRLAECADAEDEEEADGGHGRHAAERLEKGLSEVGR